MMGVPDSLENLRGRKLTEDVLASDGQIMIPRGRKVTVTLMRNALAPRQTLHLELQPTELERTG